MPKKITAAEEVIVTKASQDLYRYERTCEEHSAVLRRDPDELAKAYQEYAAIAKPMGFMPSRDEFDHYMEEMEVVLKKECRTALDHVHVVHAGLFLCQLLMTKVSEHGERVYLEFIRRKVELDKKYPYVFPKSPTAVAVHVSSDAASSSDYPITLTARAFESTEVMNLPRVSLRKPDLKRYRRCPELLQKETFVSFNEDEGEYEAFRISAFITADKEKIFYVVYADEGPEAVAFTSVHLFDLLSISERVLIQNN